PSFSFSFFLGWIVPGVVYNEMTYTLGSDSNLENLSLTEGFQINGTGNALGNVITGNALDNILNGAAGADTMIGGGGNDTFVVDNIGDVIVENSGEGTDTVQSAVSYALSANIENLALTGTAVINGTGNSLNNTLTGNSAANVLAGGAGDDTYIVGAGDTAVESANEGVDTVQSAVTYTLGANVENLTLTGSSVINGTGNNLDNILSGSGNTKANVLAGKLGDDTYIVGSGDTAVENANEGIDTVLSSIAFTLGANLENLTLTGASNINGVGNALDNILIGNSANNTLTGGAGSDTYLLDRGYGSDTIAENDATAGNTDLVLFGSGIATDQLWFSQVGNNLDVSIIGTTDKFTLSNWYLGNQYHVEQFKTSDGAILLDSQVQNLVQAMASFAPPAAGETALPANYANSLNPVIAANWH
ncbi:MAG: calcium-binding protein, partial [Polaromonas sp.]